MRRGVRALAVVCIGFGVGCAGPWTKPGATDADWEQDQAECLEASGSGDTAFGTPYNETVYQQCLLDKGWRQKPEK